MRDGLGKRRQTEGRLTFSTEERLALDRLANRRKSAQVVVVRARIVMCCPKEGAANRGVGEQLG